MPKDFPYDIIQLIRNVEERPCIWDKSFEGYKDCMERRAAWEEIFHLLEPQYTEKSAKEKKITEELIMTKWTYVRDAFVKTVRNRPGIIKKKKYIYHNELKFLLRRNPELCQNSDEAGYSSTECTDSSLYNTMPIKIECDVDEATPVLRYRTRKRKKRNSLDKNGDLSLVEVEDSDPRVMNEDEAFFASLLPSVVKYTEDERLEFRIEVLALMRRIKENRNLTELV